MTSIELKQQLHAGERLLGTCITSPSPLWPKVLAGCGLDLVFIDTEHISLNRETVSWMCRAYSAMGLPPLVRITRPDPYDMTVAFDDGAAGVIAPYVERPEQAVALRGASKFRPLKGARLDQALAGASLEPPLKSYVETLTAGNLLVLNIESVPAVQNLDAILDVEGIDSVLIGPNDLSSSLGIPEQYQHPDFLKTVEVILTKARNKGIGAGIHYWGTIEEQVRLIEMGANLFIHKADAIILRSVLSAELKEIRQRLGKGSDQSGEKESNVTI